MKKKILSLALVIALVAIMVTGTLAYFTAEDEVTNTFTVGSVKIEIYENDEPTDEEVMPFGPLTPIVNVEDPSADVSYMGKVVEVKNTGANDAYIRTHIAIPTDLVGYLYLDLNTAGWERQTDSTATVDGVNYTVFTYDYTAAVPGGEFTTELLKGVYLGSNVDLVEDASGNLLFAIRENGEITSTSAFVAHTKTANGYASNEVNVLVASQAIQTQGFENGATAALNAGFTTHPWAN